ncbi:hypothetical protein ABIA06_003120 [Bradyrhizobium yuanmingense]
MSFSSPRTQAPTASPCHADPISQPSGIEPDQKPWSLRRTSSPLERLARPHHDLVLQAKTREPLPIYNHDLALSIADEIEHAGTTQLRHCT